MSGAIPYLDREALNARLGPAEAVSALREALLGGYRPERDHARIADPLGRGEFLLMPSETAAAVGIKVLTVAPGNPERGLPRIQGLCILFDAETLAPTRLIDGPALTDRRTAAVSIAAVQDALLRSADPLEVVVYGGGPQARAHVRTVRAVLAGRRDIGSVTCVVRDPARVAPGDGAADARFTAVLPAGSPAAEAATASAGLVVCATTARTPLFAGGLVRDDAVVVAVGSHEADARELDPALLARSSVVVEELGVALRECGDVVLAIAEGALRADDLLLMADVVTGAVVPPPDRPVVFKSAGMPWQDLVVAQAAADRGAELDPAADRDPVAER